MIPDPVRTACVGASITFGLGLPNRREECYPAVMGRLLGGGYAVRNFGYSGATAGRETNEPYWQTPSMTAAERFEPELVVLMLGTNDAQHANRASLATFERDYTALIEHFQTLPSQPAMTLLLPPPVFEPLPEIDIAVVDTEIRPSIERIAAARRMAMVDLFTPLHSRADLFPDNLHPNAEGAAIIAHEVAAVVDRQNLDNG